MQDRIRLVYSKDYGLDIGNHVFPTSKYSSIKKKLLTESKFKDRIEFVSPLPAGMRDILSVHTPAYIDKLKTGRLSAEELFRLELPYSGELVDASILCCGGTMLAVDIALESRLGIHVGGGFHHAFPDHGEGFCVLNDIAVGIKYAIRKGAIRQALIVDCDLHHGNGTADIFKGDRRVFTFSVHQENNYPFFKPASSMDIGLRDRANDKEYLSCLQDNIPKIISDHKPDLIIYVAGADPYKDDRIGGLSVTKDGLCRRDEFVYKQAINFDIPMAVVLAGGYARNEEDTVDIHYNTIITGLELFYEKKAYSYTRHLRY